MKHEEVDFRRAFRATPEHCSAAMMHAARSVKEDAPARRKLPAAILIAAIMMLMMTIAVAVEGWDVLAFLRIRPDGGASGLVEPVTVDSDAAACAIRIESAITDGTWLAFDWTVENQDPSRHVYMQVDSFTGNGMPLSIDGTDDFHCQWFPGWCNDGTMQNGELVLLPEGITGDVLHVEMVVGLYTPVRPVYEMAVFDAEQARQKQQEGYYVIAGGDGFVKELPEEGLVQCFGLVRNPSAEGMTRSEMKIAFDLPLKNLSEPCALALPEPAVHEGLTLQYRRAETTQLQTTLTLLLIPAENSRDAAKYVWNDGYVTLTQTDGSWLDVNVLSGENGGAEQLADGRWCESYTLSFATDPQLPETISMSFLRDDGTVLVCPIKIR
ncbi:MAG: hypothetical protein IJZ74_07070 [Clostridia bacterium]|nr:hypothetical protein [Clostridia bacterium]